ncbi:spore germination protein GerW family protein [Paenibacillus mendelii]|uniref:spore germination protein GerW family protein n=1 Tax=Paenibacillus mendelii TaxID=206163 RepID=UPI001D8D16E0|nr:spore germination protein GerW family protein [Paenibacillus mendelii]
MFRLQTPDGSVIMPISKVGFGFVALPFGGGSGGGVSITPIAFLVVGTHGVRVVPLDNQTHLMECVIDSAPQVFKSCSRMVDGPATSRAYSSKHRKAT